MRCPKCKSEAVVRAKEKRYTLCYNCGYKELTAYFLEIGDTVEKGDINIARADAELTYEAFLSANVPDKNAKSKNEHPLLEPDNPHYNMVDGVESILRMEQMYSNEDMMTWTHITVMKYRLRIGAKDDVDKELGKIKAYEAYYKYLEAKDENK